MTDRATSAADEFESVYVAAPVALRESIGRAVLRALINVSLHRSMDVSRWSELIGAESLQALMTRKALSREEIAERNRIFQRDVWAPAVRANAAASCAGPMYHDFVSLAADAVAQAVRVHRPATLPSRWQVGADTPKRLEIDFGPVAEVTDTTTDIPILISVSWSTRLRSRPYQFTLGDCGWPYRVGCDVRGGVWVADGESEGMRLAGPESLTPALGRFAALASALTTEADRTKAAEYWDRLEVLLKLVVQ